MSSEQPTFDAATSGASSSNGPARGRHAGVDKAPLSSTDEAARETAGSEQKGGGSQRPEGMPRHASPEESRILHLQRMAQAAEQARHRARYGYTTADYHVELARSRRAKRFKVFFGVLGGILVALALACLIVFTVVFSVFGVDNNAMAPTITTGQSVAVQRGSEAADGDVVAYRSEGDVVTFGRVVACSGEWVSILSDGSVLVSNEVLDNASARNISGSTASVSISREVPQDSYYILSDSLSPSIAGLANSTDFIPLERVVGKAVFRLWPIGTL